MTGVTCLGPDVIQPLYVIKTCMSILDFTYHPHSSKLLVKSKQIRVDSKICSQIRQEVNVADDATSFHVGSYGQYQSNGHKIQYTAKVDMNVGCTVEYKVSSGKFLGVTAEASSSTPPWILIMLLAGTAVVIVGILVAAYCLCYKSPQADNSTTLTSFFHLPHIAPQQHQQQEVDTPQQQQQQQQQQQEYSRQQQAASMPQQQQEYSMQQQQPLQNVRVMSCSQGCPNRTCACWTISIGIIGVVACAIIMIIGFILMETDLPHCRANCAPRGVCNCDNVVSGLGAWLVGYCLFLPCLITSCIGWCCLCSSPPQIQGDGNVAFPQYPQQAPPNQVCVAMDANESGNGSLGVEFKPLADTGAAMPPPPAAAPPPATPPNEACEGALGMALGVNPVRMEHGQAGTGV